MVEFKDLLLLLGVIVGASIATISQLLLAKRERDEASKKLRIQKTEDTLESIAYNKRMV